jgi:hypothetical protein
MYRYNFFLFSYQDKLQHNAAQFEQHAGKLKRKFWWKNMKVRKEFLFTFIADKENGIKIN